MLPDPQTLLLGSWQHLLKHGKAGSGQQGAFGAAVSSGTSKGVLSAAKPRDVSGEDID